MTGSVIQLAGRCDSFTVAVRPCPNDQPSLERFGHYITARTHARTLRRENGWKISDEVDAGTKRKAEEAEERRVEAKRRGR